VLLGEIYSRVKSDDSFESVWAKSGCRNEGNTSTCRESAEEDVGWIVFIRIRNQIIYDVLCILDSSGEWVFWGFAIISIEHETLGASGNERAKFAVGAEHGDNERRAVID
jgi:hypothetical protein